MTESRKRRLRKSKSRTSRALKPAASVSDERKREIVGRIRERVRRYSAHLASSPGTCVTHSNVAMLELLPLGFKATLQAGSAYWPRRGLDYDDGTPTHFGFVWEPDAPQSKYANGLGYLQEIHVWVGLSDTQEVIDLTTGKLPECCKIMLEFDWPGPKPPDYFWGHMLPPDVRYEPDEAATIYAALRIWNRYRPYYLSHIRDKLAEAAEYWGLPFEPENPNVIPPL